MAANAPLADGTDWTIGTTTALSLALARRADRQDAPMAVVCRDEHEASRLEEELRFFGGDNLAVLHYPDLETLAYDALAPHQDIVSQRLATLAQIEQFRRGVIVVSAPALLRRTAPLEFISGRVFSLKPGDRVNPGEFATRLDGAGYSHVPEVRGHGEFCVRGAIIDVFPMGSTSPQRIDLFDDSVDSIRTFDPETQRSLEQTDKLEILPGHEFPTDGDAINDFRSRFRRRFPDRIHRSRVYDQVSEGLFPGIIDCFLPLFFEHSSHLLDHLPVETRLFIDSGVEAALNASWLEINERFEHFAGDPDEPLLPPDEAYVDPARLQAAFDRHNTTQVTLDPADGWGAPLELNDGINGLPALLETYSGFRLTLTAWSAGRREALSEQLGAAGLPHQRITDWAAVSGSSDRITLITAPIDGGFVLGDEKHAVVTESELLGNRPPVRKRRRSITDPESAIASLADLAIGAPVVHRDHGVGRYRGLTQLDGNDDTEFLLLEYAGGDKLFVPVASLHMVHRYTGASEDEAPWNSLGNEKWKKARRKAAERVKDVAAELLELHAKRAARKGRKLTVAEADYHQFCRGFPFTETDDQARAIDQVLSDFACGRPMDRVVCGDVGFGKTEVALRAAYVAASSGVQVCLLVPTTLLARQHEQTFRDRFADTAIRIAGLSRMGGRAAQQTTLQALADGRVDIVIGTHRLLQKDVKFKDLGLVIVDEEHRFGVQHKERIKALRAEVHMLTLTATPIPRTLNMCLSGIRDMSIIATPPNDRVAISTIVSEWNETVIHDACLRELRRGGQVYFLHNRVDSIERVALQLAEIVPQARVRFAHGQMSERELESVMHDFYRHRFNVLVSTTIIESGIDIPSANTILIDRADKLGLAQLHQLRGRVGRSHHQAYAYLLTPPEEILSGDALKRLDAIRSLNELGAGYLLATHDMEIRGAGDLLGKAQSGEIEQLGFSLYIELLDKAVRSLGGESNLPPANPDVDIDLGLPALLPDDYVPDVHTRLVLYKRISAAVGLKDLNNLKVELIDRFGLIPEYSNNLFELAALRQSAGRLGINKIWRSGDNVRLRFDADPTVDATRLAAAITGSRGNWRFASSDTIALSVNDDSNAARLDSSKAFLQSITPQSA